jgi:hypothetical protein
VKALESLPFLEIDSPLDKVERKILWLLHGLDFHVKIGWRKFKQLRSRRKRLKELVQSFTRK